MIKYIEKHPIISICIFVLITLLPNLGIFPVSIMEARDFITAREMVCNGNWILTTMNGIARYEKPPLPTWLSALSSMIFGISSVWAMRLPQVLMVIFTGIFSFLFSNLILKNKIHSFYNAIITITSFYVIGIIFEAPWDIFTHAFMLSGIYYLFKSFEAEQNKWPNIILSGLFTGLSFLSKGPVSLYALLLPFLIAYGITYKLKLKRKILPVITIILISLSTGIWWYLYIRLKDPLSFSEIAGRETGNWGKYHIKPFYFYWSFFTKSGLWTIPSLISLLYPYMKNKVTNIKAYKLTLLWTAFSVILLSVIPEKKDRYIMPVLIPLSINTGFYIEYLFRKFKTITKKKELFPIYFNYILIALSGFALPAIIYFITKKNLSGNMSIYILSSCIFITSGAGIVFNLRKKEIKQTILLSILFYACIFIFALPMLKKTFISKNYVPISGLKEKSEKHDLKIYLYDYISPEMLWQYGNKIPELKRTGNNFDTKETQFGLLVNSTDKNIMQNIEKKYTIKKIKTFNLNTANRNGSRLKNDFYILRKK